MTRISRRKLLVRAAGAGLLVGGVPAATSAQLDDLAHDPRFARNMRGSAASRLVATKDDPLLALDDLLAGEPGVYGLVVVDQRGHLRYSRNARLPFISASLYKLILAAEIIRQIEAGVVRWDQMVVLEEWYFPAGENWDGAYDYDMIGAEVPISEALWATICVSSNIGAMALLQLTSSESMNTLSRSLGLNATNFASVLSTLEFWPPAASAAETPEQLTSAIQLIETSSYQWNVNLTSPADMVRFTYEVLHGSLISEFVSFHLLRLLLSQEISDRMPALLPAGTTIAHKTGNLTSIVHDAGAILTNEGPILLAMLTQAVPDEYHTTRLLQSISAMVYAELLDP